MTSPLPPHVARVKGGMSFVLPQLPAHPSVTLINADYLLLLLAFRSRGKIILIDFFEILFKSIDSKLTEITR